MENNAKCFIKNKDGHYEEITYQELQKRRLKDYTYKFKKFIPIQKMLIEVSIEEYRDFYRDIERRKYLKKQAKNYKFISINEISNHFDIRERNILADTDTNIEFEVERKMEIERLKKALLELGDEDYKIIKALFYEENSVRKYAEKVGIPFMTIQNRKKKILKKLKKILKN